MDDYKVRLTKLEVAILGPWTHNQGWQFVFDMITDDDEGTVDFAINHFPHSQMKYKLHFMNDQPYLQIINRPLHQIKNYLIKYISTKEGKLILETENGGELKFHK